MIAAFRRYASSRSGARLGLDRVRSGAAVPSSALHFNGNYMCLLRASFFSDRCIDSGFNGPGYSHYGEKYYELYDGEDIEDPAAREEMRSWARHEFKRNKNVEEMTQIRYLISQGRHEMETISQSIGYSFKG
ncbi:hypothetical protein TWF173_009484 [Orbilia oligospora]|nr:hypothetical protein TWF173_009484 [Orbilia oligospora]